MGAAVLERALLAAGLALLLLLAYRSANALLLRRRARQALGLPAYQPGRPAVLYFTTPGCLPCKTIQRPALNQLRRRYGDRLQIIEIDASQEPGLAAAWGVLTAPTTFLIDPAGRPRGVNHGLARATKLIGQLTAIGAPPPTAAPGRLPASEEAVRTASTEGR
jgi:thiol-disulfide isomerase/thioredoxin